MKIIDKIIKILINFRYKRKPFMAWCWEIDGIHEINILSAEYYKDYYRYGTREEYYKVESEDTEKLIPCINYEDGGEEWIGHSCVYYKSESEEKDE
jgi:hypothetical protein